MSGDEDLDLQLALRKRTRVRAIRRVVDPKEEEERDHTYMELLARAYAIHKERHPRERETLRVPHARMGRLGGRRTVVLNFAEICARLRRVDDLRTYVAAETQADASVDARGALVLCGRFTGDQVDTLIRAYANAYVICRTCRGGDTRLVNESRLRFLVCEACGGKTCVN